MYELLILGPRAWEAELEGFRQYKQDTGIPSAVITVEDAEKGPGSDSPERIKRRIEVEHRLNGATHVMLVGDADRFPVRYIKATNTEWGAMWYASDLYYADLYDDDGSFADWDADGDGIHAEMDFGQTGDAAKFNIDKIHLHADVVVGRVPASTKEEAACYFDKVRAYESAARESVAYGHPRDWFRDAVFASGAGFSSSADDHTVPLRDAGFRIIRRYEDDATWGGAPLSAARHTELRNLLAEGAGILHFRGHGSPGGWGDWCSAADVALLNNADRLPIVVAMTCLSAKFHLDKNEYLTAMGTDWIGSQAYHADRPEPAHLQPKHDQDSMAEEFLVRRATGAIAYLGASHKMEHGGYPLGRYLFEAYRDAPKPPTLGSLWRQALNRFVADDLAGGTIGMGPYYAFIHAHKVVLFGDPSLRVGGLAAQQWANPPTEFGAEVLQAALD